MNVQKINLRVNNAKSKNKNEQKKEMMLHPDWWIWTIFGTAIGWTVYCILKHFLGLEHPFLKF